MPLHRRSRKLLTALVFVLALEIPAGPMSAFAAARAEEVSYNTEYIFPLTRALNDWDVHPALKVTLVPATLVLDLAALPFGLVMGFFPSDQPGHRAR